MKITLLGWNENQWNIQDQASDHEPDLFLLFGGVSPQETTLRYEKLREQFSEADIVGCSTAGEIMGWDVSDDGGVAVGMSFDSTNYRSHSLVISSPDQSRSAGEALGKELLGEGLRAVLAFSDGNIVNGSALVEGLTAGLPEGVFISGGLAGDGGKFERTAVIHNGEARSGQIVAVGLYGEKLQVACGSVGGWTPFGPMRTITRSDSNKLYELDGKPALALYKHYLGDAVDLLPGSALNFPIMIKPASQSVGEGLVRTILSVDEQEQTLTFAGDTPQGYSAQLMMASYESLVEGAAQAAEEAANGNIAEIHGDSLALLISCVGRKIVLGSRVDEEVEAVIESFPPATKFAGYYSYGEISPHSGGMCELHNQTMTITYLAETA